MSKSISKISNFKPDYLKYSNNSLLFPFREVSLSLLKYIINQHTIMGTLKEKFKAKADELGAEIKQIIKDHGDETIGEVKLRQIYTGMRGITALATETSLLDPQEGIRFRGYTIPELKKALPSAEDGTEPLPEGLFYLLLLGEIPTRDDVNALSERWKSEGKIPDYVFSTIDALPEHAHPMTQFVTGIMALQSESVFAKNMVRV